MSVVLTTSQTPATMPVQAHVNKPLASVTLSDLQSFADSLTDLSANSAKRTINAVKSLLTFGQKLGYFGYLPFSHVNIR